MILGLEKSAKMTEIKKAYRELAMKWHPDRNNQDEEASNKAKEMMAMVNEANETLSNPKKRKDYDLEYEEYIAEKHGESGLITEQIVKCDKNYPFIASGSSIDYKENLNSELKDID